MMKLILFTVSIWMVEAITDPTHLCDELMSLDCKVNYIPGEKDETVCGTNGATYNNFCYYSQARCNNKNIALAYVGSCKTVVATSPTPMTAAITATGPVITTPMTVVMSTTTSAPTPDPILEAFCSNKNAIVCGTELSPICGSDKQFYLNKCEYSKAYCDDKTLSSKPIEFCTGGAGRK